MAKLTPKDPQFGIPIACRIDGDIAFRLNDNAAKEGISLSRYLSRYIKNIGYKAKRIKELEGELETEKEIYKLAVTRTILHVTNGKEKETKELIQIFKTEIENERKRRNNAVSGH